MGFPPCARSLSHWFSPAERGRSFSIWNIGHQLGAAGVFVMSGYLVAYGWRYCFWGPAGIAFLGGLFLLERMRDTPQSLGLPAVETWRGEESTDQLEAELHGELTQSQFVARY